jgi:hypothetical protein
MTPLVHFAKERAKPHSIRRPATIGNEIGNEIGTLERTSVTKVQQVQPLTGLQSIGSLAK